MHSENFCSPLDEYLAGDLVGPPREAFERHLSDCPRCRDEAESYARLAELLQTADRQLVRCPPALSTRTHDALLRRQLRRRITVATAVVLLTAIGGVAWMANGKFGPAHPENRQQMADRNDEHVPDLAPASDGQIGAVESPRPFPPRSAGEQAAAVHVEFGGDVIGVPIETDDPAVTILWVYPTLGQVAGGD